MKILRTLAVAVLLTVPLLLVQPTFAQNAPDTIDMEFDSDVVDYQYDYSFGDIEDASSVLDEKEFAGALAAIFTGGFLIVYMFIMLGVYVYSAVTLQKTADRIGEPNSWFAWIPVLNMILLYRMGDKNPWYLLLAFIPFVGAVILLVFTILATMKVCEKRGYDPLYALLTLIPIGAFILWAILAWGKKGEAKPAAA